MILGLSPVEHITPTSRTNVNFYWPGVNGNDCPMCRMENWIYFYNEGVCCQPKSRVLVTGDGSLELKHMSSRRKKLITSGAVIACAISMQEYVGLFWMHSPALRAMGPQDVMSFASLKRLIPPLTAFPISPISLFNGTFFNAFGPHYKAT